MSTPKTSPKKSKLSSPSHKMKCYFCGRFCRKDNPPHPKYNEDVTFWICPNHPIQIKLRQMSNPKHDCFSFKFYLKKSLYKILIYPNNNEASLLVHDVGYGCFKRIIKFNSIPKLTPTNYQQKLPTYLTFS